MQIKILIQQTVLMIEIGYKMNNFLPLNSFVIYILIYVLTSIFFSKMLNFWNF